MSREKYREWIFRRGLYPILCSLEASKDKIKDLFYEHTLVFPIAALFIAFLIAILTSDYDVVHKVFSTLSDTTFLGIVLTMVSIMLSFSVALLSLRREEYVERVFRVKVIALFSVAIFLFIAVKTLLSIYGPEDMFLAFLIVLCWSLVVATIMHIIYFLTMMNIEKVLDYTCWVLIIACTAVIIIPIIHLFTAVIFHKYSALAEIGMEFLRTLFIVAILVAIITAGFSIFFKQIQVKSR